jgi:hypothetical protein
LPWQPARPVPLLPPFSSRAAMATEHRPCCRVPSSPGAVAFLLPPDPNARGQYTIIGEAAAARPTAGAPSRRSVVARRSPASCYAPSPHRPWSTTAFHCEVRNSLAFPSSICVIPIDAFVAEQPRRPWPSSTLCHPDS